MRHSVSVMKNYLLNLILSLRDLTHSKSSLSLKNIRPERIRYLLAFSLAMVSINVQNCFIDGKAKLFGVPETMIMFLAFAVGATVMFALTNEKNLPSISKISAAIAFIAFVPWFILPGGLLTPILAAALMFGIGGCISESGFSYVFLLNNAERFFSCAFMLILIGLIRWSGVCFDFDQWIRKAVAMLLVVPCCVCLFTVSSRDIDFPEKPAKKSYDISIWLVLFIFASYFAIRITGFYSPAFSSPADAGVWGFSAIILLVIIIVFQLTLKRSTWFICCIFYISSVLSHIFWYTGKSELAYFFSELKNIGFPLCFYLIGCVTNKFCDFKMHKRLIIICISLVAVLYAGIDILHMYVTSTQLLASSAAAVSFIIFLLLSPVFSKYLFFSDWASEMKSINMVRSCTDEAVEAHKSGQSCGAAIYNSVLTPREKQLVLLLLQGKTLRQTAAELGLTVSTVSTYSKTIYKKLNINSRAELFLLFRPPEDPDGKSDA